MILPKELGKSERLFHDEAGYKIPDLTTCASEYPLTLKLRHVH